MAGTTKADAGKGDAGADLKELTGADILRADDLKIEPVDVPEWRGRVYVREMSAAARDWFDDQMAGDDDKPDMTNFRARFVVATCCDAKGKLLFAPGQVALVAEKASGPVARIFERARALNKVGAKQVEAEKKDSAEVPSAGSPTGSP